MSCIIIYFSRKGATKAVAAEISRQLNCDTKQLMPGKRYSRLFTKCLIRAYRDKSKRRYPSISGGKLNLSLYDTIILGFPIWMGAAPRIINTFLSAYKLKGKRIVPFCTCWHSEGTAFDELAKEYKDNNWHGGTVFKSRKNIGEDTAKFIMKHDLVRHHKEK